MRMYDIIQKKRDGRKLSKQEIEFFIDGYVKGEIPDYQVSALLMACYFNSMNKEETFDLTKAMLDSGEKADLSMFGGLSVDKHSTGGVGDKTTLIVAPIVASLGCFVAKMSGRGLGHTGGTVDKLESINGYNTSLEPDEFIDITKKCGVCVVGQTGNFAPADKKLYALRDVTATVDNIPLIASSIMSKKLAAGADTIVLDVKVGSGAFMKNEVQAKALAKCMVEIGESFNRKTAALITNMDMPLGLNIGNALEIKEAVEVLKGNGPDDLKNVCIELSSLIVSLALSKSINEAKVMVKEVLSNGVAYAKFLEWISLQGGDISVFDDLNEFCKPKFSFDIVSKKDGFIKSMNAELIGKASVVLGAGRNKKEDEIDFSAGIVLEKKCGDFVKKGETLAKLYSSSTKDFSIVEKMYLSAIEFSDNKPKQSPLIIDVVTKETLL